MARLSKMAVGVAALLLCASAWADPISLIATAIVYISGYTGITALAIIAAGSLLSGSMASNQAKRKQAEAAAQARSQSNANLQDRNVTGLSAEAPWQIVYGAPAPVGGSITAILSSGGKDEFKHVVVVFAAHESAAIGEIYLDGEPVGALDFSGRCTSGAFYESGGDKVITESVQFNTAGTAAVSRTVVGIVSAVQGTGDGESAYSLTYSVNALGTTLSLNFQPTAPFFASVTYKYSTATGRVNIQKHLSPGGNDSVDLYLYAATAGGAWGSPDKLSGYTYAVVTLDQNLARFQGGPPNISARISGKKVYDPRSGTTVYSSNPALCLADFIMSEAGYGATLAQFDSASLVAAANACDASGFSCDGAFKTDQDRETTKQQLENSFGGMCHQSGGVWRISAGAWTTPVMSLTDADCAAPIQITQASYTSKERYNTVRGKYVNGDGLGVSTDFTPWQNAAYVATDGLVKVKDISLPFTKNHQRAQDLARMIVERSRGGLTITYPGHMRLWPLQPGDRVSSTNTEYGWAGKTFRVTDWGFHPKTPVALSLVEDVAVYYNAAAVITADAAPNTNLPNPYATPAPFADLTAESGTARLLKQADGTITTRVFVQWPASANNYVASGGNVQIQWRLAIATDDVWINADLLPGDSVNTYLSGLLDKTTALVRGRFINQLGIPGTWTTITHKVIGKTEPPPQVTGVALSTDRVFFNIIDRVVVVDMKGYLIRVVPGLVPIWSLGVPLHQGVVTDSPWRFPTQLFGVQTVMVSAVDDSNNVSAAGSATQDFGQPNVSTAIQVRDYKAEGWLGFITNSTATAGASLIADADPTVDFWAIGADDFWTRDNAADFFGGSLYKAMVYQFTFTPQYGGGQILLLSSASGSRVTVEYRISGGTTGDFWAGANGVASADFWGASDEFWGAVSQWLPWIGSAVSVKGNTLDFRVTTDGGPIQGSIDSLTLNLILPSVSQIFSVLPISAGGTRLLPSAGLPPRNWIRVTTVSANAISDGSGAVTMRIKDFDPVNGPLIEMLNTAGAAVAATTPPVVYGYEDTTP